MVFQIGDRRIGLKTLITLLTAAGLVGGMASAGLDWLGHQGRSPAERLTTMESEMEVLKRDSLASLRVRDELLRLRVDTLENNERARAELFDRYLAAQCLNPGMRARLAQTQIPCARLLRRLGINP